MKLNNLFVKLGICACICLDGFASGQSDTPVDTVAVIITAAANADKVSNTDLAIWYSIYHGSELYGTKFDFDKRTDFGILFDKQRKIRNALLPSKTVTLGVEINKVFKKYEGTKTTVNGVETIMPMDFDDNSKNKFIEDCASVARGLKAAID